MAKILGGAPSGARVMSQHSAGPDRGEGPIRENTWIWVGPSNAILEPKARCVMRRLAAGTQHGGNLAPAIEPAQTDLAADDETEAQHEGRVLGGQAALRLHTSAELLVEALDHVGGPERLPLAFRKLKER